MLTLAPAGGPYPPNVPCRRQPVPQSAPRHPLRRRAEELVFIGMAPPPAKVKEEDPLVKEAEVKRRRKLIQAQHEDEYRQALVALDKEVYETEGPDMKEEMMDQLRDWCGRRRERGGRRHLLLALASRPRGPRPPTPLPLPPSTRRTPRPPHPGTSSTASGRARSPISRPRRRRNPPPKSSRPWPRRMRPRARTRRRTRRRMPRRARAPKRRTRRRRRRRTL